VKKSDFLLKIKKGNNINKKVLKRSVVLEPVFSSILYKIPVIHKKESNFKLDLQPCLNSFKDLKKKKCKGASKIIASWLGEFIPASYLPGILFINRW